MILLSPGLVGMCRSVRSSPSYSEIEYSSASERRGKGVSGRGERRGFSAHYCEVLDGIKYEEEDEEEARET